MRVCRRLLYLVMMGVAFGPGLCFSQPSGTPSGAAAAEPSTLSADEAEIYRLGPGDKLRLITYDEPQLTGEFYIGSSGAISLPLIGEVPANQRTVGQLQADIIRLLKDGFIKNPSISIEVLTFRPFYILGEVNKPGQYPYTSDMTLENAVATAGGFTYRANQGNVFIKHHGQAAEAKIHVAPSTMVLPGDTVRVAERYF